MNSSRDTIKVGSLTAPYYESRGNKELRGWILPDNTVEKNPIRVERFLEKRYYILINELSK